MNKIMLGIAALVMFAGVTGDIGTSRADDAATTAPATTAPATEAAASTKFYGSVSAIDAKAMTFTIGDQTFAVGADVKMTKADGSTATLADAVVGEPARGTYTTGSDGKLNVEKVRFGKKTGGKGGGKGGKKKDQPTTTTQQ
jgi:hypothetical protein